MLGLGKVPEILYTRDIEDAFVQGLQRCAPGAEVWVVSPYNTIDKLGTIRRAIIKACKDGVRVKYVVRDEPPQVDGARQSLGEAMENGLELFVLERLHAKLYWFEDNYAIVTSANMVDASFEKSTELGLCVPVGGLFGDLRNWINEEIIPDARRIRLPTAADSSRPSPSPPRMNDTVQKGVRNDGFCLRCGKAIALNRKAPYCLDHYKVWVQFSNRGFVEKYCHACGGESETTMDRPVCRTCFRKGAP